MVTIGFITHSVTLVDHPVAFWGIAALFVFAGIVAYLILFRIRFAYDLAIVYCVAALLFLSALTALNIGVVNKPYATYFLLVVVYGGIGVYFLRHRNEWNKILDQKR